MLRITYGRSGVPLARAAKSSCSTKSLALSESTLAERRANRCVSAALGSRAGVSEGSFGRLIGPP
jgi:hypothetical protein